MDNKREQLRMGDDKQNRGQCKYSLAQRIQLSCASANGTAKQIYPPTMKLLSDTRNTCLSHYRVSLSKPISNECLRVLIGKSFRWSNRRTWPSYWTLGNVFRSLLTRNKKSSWETFLRVPAGSHSSKGPCHSLKVKIGGELNVSYPCRIQLCNGNHY